MAVTTLLVRSFLPGVFLALIATPLAVNAQAFPNPLNYAYPACAEGHSCGREFVFPLVRVGNGFTAHFQFPDGQPDGVIVEWLVSWADVAPDGTVQLETAVSASYNGFPLSSQLVEVDLGQCSDSSCKATLDILAPLCPYAGGQCPVGSPPPAEMDLVVVGWLKVSDAASAGKVLAPTVQVLYNGADGGTTSAVWLDPDPSVWSAPVVVGAGNGCKFGVVDLSPQSVSGPAPVATLVDAVSGNVMDQATLSGNLSGTAPPTFDCGTLFSKLPSQPTQARLEVYDGTGGIAVLVMQTSAGVLGNSSQPVVTYFKRTMRIPKRRVPRNGSAQ
jgi:hypothetical protein